MNLIKYALITGASRGIGREIAYQLAKENYHLYLICHTQMELLTELKKEIENKYSVSCKCYCGDISDPEFVESVFSQISSLDVLINNAGISYFGLIQDMSYEDWNRIIKTNLSSAFYTSHKAVPIMLKAQAGNIINISSVWGSKGASMEVAYSASKGGLNAFTSALAKELAPSGIKVNAIACGLIDTDMNHNLTQEDIETLCEEIPMGRMGTPTEVAVLVGQLLKAPSYLSGQIIPLDGCWI